MGCSMLRLQFYPNWLFFDLVFARCDEAAGLLFSIGRLLGCSSFVLVARNGLFARSPVCFD